MCGALFAYEVTGWGAAGVGSLATAILLGLGALAAKYFRAKGGYAKDVAEAEAILAGQAREARREDDAAEAKRDNVTVKELKSLVEAYKQSHAESRQEIHELRDEMAVLSNKLTVCEVGCARRDERIAALEDALEEARIPHRKWNPGAPGSGEHGSLKTPPPARPNPSEGASGE
jgi:hypothetical protein